MADSNWQLDPSGYIAGAIGGPVSITSGYRTVAHNAAVGGVPNSAHLSGQAYDFVPRGMSTAQAAQKLASSGVPFDQVINEGDHVHVSFAPSHRGQVLNSQPQDVDFVSAIQGAAKQPAPAPQNTASGDTDFISAIQKAAPKAPQGTPAPSSAPPPGGPPPPPVNTVGDVLNAIPGGLAKGVTGILGIPGDVEMLASKTGQALHNLLFQNQTAAQKAKYDAWVNAMGTDFPTSSTLNDIVSKPFNGFYQPKTIPGQYAETIASFAPAAAAPGSPLLRAARVVIPGAASETAGQLTKGSPYEGLARFGGAIAGAMGVGAAHQLIENGSVPPTPTTQDIRNAASGAYKQAEQAGVIVKEGAVKNLGQQIATDLDEKGIDTVLHPRASRALDRIVNSEGDLSFKRLDILRRVAKSAAASPDDDEARLGSTIIRHIDDFVQNIGPGDVVSGDTDQAASAITKARSLWARQAKSDIIDTALERAKNRAETIGGSGLENGIRIEFRRIAQNPNLLNQFGQAEQDAIKTVARGTATSNALRTIGKLAPTNAMTILGEMAVGAFRPEAMAFPAAGIVGRMGATAMTARAANAASELVRSGGVAPQAQQVFTPELLTAILGRQKALQQSQEQPQPNALMPQFAGR